jgi:hypothetical protein
MENVMGVFEAIGMFVSAVFALAIGWLIWTIICNIYGGIKGAHRLRKLLTEHKGKPPFGHWKALRLGLYCWAGRRYKDGIGEYWQIGGMEVPLDGRDKIGSRYYG